MAEKLSLVLLSASALLATQGVDVVEITTEAAEPETNAANTGVVSNKPQKWQNQIEATQSLEQWTIDFPNAVEARLEPEPHNIKGSTSNFGVQLEESRVHLLSNLNKKSSSSIKNQKAAKSRVGSVQFDVTSFSSTTSENGHSSAHIPIIIECGMGSNILISAPEADLPSTTPLITNLLASATPQARGLSFDNSNSASITSRIQTVSESDSDDFEMQPSEEEDKQTESQQQHQPIQASTSPEISIAISSPFRNASNLFKMAYNPERGTFDIRITLRYSTFVTAVHLIDIALELLTIPINHSSLQDKKEPTLKDWHIAYLTHPTFYFDLMAIPPFELLPFPNAKYLWVLRLLKLHKLPTILSTSPFFKQLQKDIAKLLRTGNSSISLVFPLLLVFCTFQHLQACILFLGARLFNFNNPESQQYESVGLWDQYTWSIFVSVANQFPVGYKPAEPAEQWSVIIFAIIGAGLYASIVGMVSSVAMGLDASGRLYREKLDEMHEYMRYKDLDASTRRKILKFYDIKYRGKYFEETVLLSDLNESLRMEIAAHNCRDLINKVSFLRREQNDGRDELFVGRIATAFISCYYVTGDILFTQGQAGQEMVTATSCMMYRLTRVAFTSILEEFDDVKRAVNEIYNERMEKVKIEEEARKLETAKDLVQKVTFLNRQEADGRNEDFLVKLATALKPVYLVVGDVVFSRGDTGNEMVSPGHLLPAYAKYELCSIS
ncbi:anaphase-promoting complex subunit Hcn1 [Podochytrium sp. JEL0797]|nr:anaphase-promoting complex subunit Hcn1 [Podochytrium sp. JEL0797]